MNDTLVYPYRPNPRSMILPILFFGACAAIGVVAARTNDAGLIIGGLITLSVRGATIFYWCLAAASLLFVLAGVWGIVAGRNSQGLVRLTPAEISAPRTMRAREPTVVRLSEIQGLAMGQIQGRLLLTIRHPGGSLSIAESMLPNGAFDVLCRTLRARLDAIPAAEKQVASRV